MTTMMDLLLRLASAVPCRVAADQAAAEEAARSLGFPVRVSGGAWRMRVDTEADIALAWVKARKRGHDGPVLIQAWTEGETYRVVGFKVHRAFWPVEVVSETWLDGLHPIPMMYAVPCGLEGRHYAEAIELAREAGTALPAGGYCAEVELIKGKERFTVSDLRTGAAPEPMISRLLELAQGIDLDRAARRAALGEPPDLSPVRDMAVAVCWMTTHSGVVASVGGIDAARAIPGVETVSVNVREGETLGHVMDIESRDRVGWVIATAPMRAMAIERALAARDAIRIFTRRTLD